MSIKVQKTILLNMLVLLSVILTSCSSTGETLQYEGDTQMRAKLKIMAIDNKKGFMEDYGHLFNAKYPNIEIELINFGENNFDEVLASENPDVLLTSLDQYEQLVQNNKLYDLDALMNKDEFNLNGMHQGIVEYLRVTGKGKLYGLPPQLLPKALFYNKDLFDKYSIPYPEDQMTWEEVLQLAGRFPVEDGVNGLYMKDFNTFVEALSRSYSLSMVNVKDLRVTINTDSYNRMFNMILDAHQSGAVVMPGLDALDVNDPFVTGASAMTMDYYYYINNNIGRAKIEQGNKLHLNWDVVTAPVNETHREISPYFHLVAIFSVQAKSEQKQAAWEFVKFVNSEEFAQARSRTNQFTLPSRADFVYNPEGKRMEAFYKLKPDVNWTPVNYDLLPKGFYGKMRDIINSEGKAAMVGAKTLEDAIASMQERGQQLLEQNK